MTLGWSKKLMNKVKTFVTKTLPSAINKELEVAGKVINTVAPIASKAAGVLQMTPLGRIANQIAGELTMVNNVVQKGRGFMQNFQPMIGNGDDGSEHVLRKNKFYYF
ncbi:MAG: hypothetical protein Ta2E_00660 [Mycoplasmoidaceae bacterium]|nr:MAG: hypothetical protein Ta2E_00660 [Mycoplasmoidaceae bacterium]